MDRFSRTQVLALLHLGGARLRYWEGLRLVTPVLERGRAWYSLQDLIALRAVLRLTSQNVPAVRVRAALRQLVDGDEMALKKPLIEMRLEALGGEVVGVHHGLLVEPATGERVLDVLADTLDTGTVAPLRRVAAADEIAEEVDELLAAAMRADLDPDRWDHAAHLYRSVLGRAPHCVPALINLGTLECKRRRFEAAEAAYRTVLSIDPRHAVAHFNLANVLDEQRRCDEALAHLLAAVAADPQNGDVRFNLGLLLDKLGRPAEARPHWLAYLQTDDNSEWAALARRHLAMHVPDNVIPLRSRARA